MARFTKIPADTFKHLVINAGILLKDFDPSGADEWDPKDQIGATSGGITFTTTPTWTDYGDNVDNCPKNTKEMKRLDEVEAKLTGTLLTITPEVAKSLLAAADVSSTDATKIVPRRDIADADFADIWFVSDYSDKNGANNGGYIAIHLMNALSTGGLQLKTTDKNKGEMAFEYTAHYSISNPDIVPFEIYIVAGTAET